MGRGRAGPREFLKHFRGKLQSDGYVVYDNLAEGIVSVGCLAYARCGFVDAAKLAPHDPLPAEVPERFGRLYAVEEQARQAWLGAPARPRASNCANSKAAPAGGTASAAGGNLPANLAGQQTGAGLRLYPAAMESPGRVGERRRAGFRQQLVRGRDAADCSGPQELIAHWQRAGGTESRSHRVDRRDLRPTRHQSASVSQRCAAPVGRLAGPARGRVDVHSLESSPEVLTFPQSAPAHRPRLAACRT